MKVITCPLKWYFEILKNWAPILSAHCTLYFSNIEYAWSETLSSSTACFCLFKLISYASCFDWFLKEAMHSACIIVMKFGELIPIQNFQIAIVCWYIENYLLYFLCYYFMICHDLSSKILYLTYHTFDNLKHKLLLWRYER